MKNLFLYLLFFVNFFIFSDNSKLQKLYKINCPDKYTIMFFKSGYINNDKIIDSIVIYAANNEAETKYKNEKRTLVVFLSKSENQYKKFVNKNLIPYYGFDKNFPESFVDITISKGSFNILLYGGFSERWGREITFKYNDKIKKIDLISDKTEFYKSNNPEEIIRIQDNYTTDKSYWDLF